MVLGSVVVLCSLVVGWGGYTCFWFTVGGVLVICGMLDLVVGCNFE